MRARYQGQTAGDEQRGNAAVVSDHYDANDLCEGQETAKLRRLALAKNWEQFANYIEQLKLAGHKQYRIESMMSRAMYGVKI